MLWDNLDGTTSDDYLNVPIGQKCVNSSSVPNQVPI